MPQTFFGPYGENNSTYANAGNANLGRFPLGHTLVLPDGREYKFTLNDATAEVAGNLYQGVAAVADHTNRSADTARAVGATVISATLGATAAATDIYAEGIVHTNDAAGEGYSHRIRRAFTSANAHASAATSSILTVNLEAGDTVQVALTTASEVSFSRNRYHAVTIHVSPPTAQLAGVSPGIAAASRFYWSQVKGYAAVLADGTMLAGLPAQASITVDGAVENYKRRVRTGGTTVAATGAAQAFALLTDQDGTTTTYYIGVTSALATGTVDISGPIAINAPIVGRTIKANADTEYALIELAIA